jgi:putative hydrolase of the HAD superfamily
MSTDVATMIASKKAILFDLFHTLTALEITDPGGVSTSGVLGIPPDVWNNQVLLKTRERMTGEWTDPYYIIGTMARRIRPELTDEQIRAAADRRIARFADSLRRIPAVSVQTVKSLRERGKLIALVSNADVTEVSAWDESPIAPLFDTVVFSCAVGAVKPEPGIYTEALNRLGVASEEAAFVGDGGSDELRGARELGITTVMMAGVLRKFSPHRIDERREHADFIVDSVDELLGD